MPKKKLTTPPKPKIVKKLIGLPDDWIAKIDRLRGELSFSDYVRAAVLKEIGAAGLSEMPAWGQGRPPKQM